MLLLVLSRVAFPDLRGKLHAVLFIHVWEGGGPVAACECRLVRFVCVCVCGHRFKHMFIMLDRYSMERLRRYTNHTYMHTSYIHTLYVRTYTHTYIYTYIHTYINTCINTYIHTYIHTHIHASMHACIHTSKHSCSFAGCVSIFAWLCVGTRV